MPAADKKTFHRETKRRSAAGELQLRLKLDGDSSVSDFFFFFLALLLQKRSFYFSQVIFSGLFLLCEVMNQPHCLLVYSYSSPSHGTRGPTTHLERTCYKSDTKNMLDTFNTFCVTFDTVYVKKTN